jgi:hypothetical protein
MFAIKRPAGPRTTRAGSHLQDCRHNHAGMALCDPTQRIMRARQTQWREEHA